MISWKHSFSRLNEEYDLARKKRQALDNLADAGKISESTHGMFNREIDDAIAEIENQRKALLEKITAKTIELEDQIRTLEVLLTTFEIQHVTGEIDEQIYQRQTDLLSMGLETTRQELSAVQEAANTLASNDAMLLQPSAEPEDTQPRSPQSEAKLTDEPVPPTEKEHAEEIIVETIQPTTEEEQPEQETATESKQET